MSTIDIKISELKVASDHNSILNIPSIVSGLGIIMYDPTKKIGGAIHVMLPNCRPGSDSTPQKFVDTGISLLIQELEKQGAQRANIIVKLAGGAKMLKSGGIAIGERNLQTAKETLTKEKLTVKGLDIGGSVKRKISLNLSNGEVIVERLNEGTKKI